LIPISAKAAKDLVDPTSVARELRAGQQKGGDCWPSASLSIITAGEAYLDPTYDDESVIGDEEFPPMRFADDQARYPHAVSKLQVQHQALITRGKNQQRLIAPNRISSPRDRAARYRRRS
jgi:hypothetical protein